jgi:hypothetical protein
METDG